MIFFKASTMKYIFTLFILTGILFSSRKASAQDFQHMSMKQIEHYRDSVTKAVLKEHKVSPNYGVTQPQLDKLDTSVVSVQFFYQEVTHTNFDGGGSFDGNYSISASSRTATMLSGNNNIRIVSSNKSFEGLSGLDNKLRGTVKVHSEQIGYTSHAVGHETGVEPTELGFSFSLDKASNIAGVSVSGSTKMTHSGSDDSERGTVSCSVGNDPLQVILPEGQQANRMDGKNDYCIITKTPTGYNIKYNTVEKQEGLRTVTTTTKNLSVMIGYTPKEYEAVITPVNWDYEKWIPKGPKVNGTDDTKGDRSRKFKIVVREKADTTKLYPEAYTVTWGLSDVTKYLGFCNNYPKFDNPITDPDLKFDDTLKTQIEFEHDVTDDYAKTITGAGSYTFVTINCMDYAAWGKLVASVELIDGTVIHSARPYYSKTKEYLTIPYDRDENKLADQWEINNHILHSGHALDWDEDNKPEKQRDNGDGYTLFEEYRGFAEHKPKETSPDKMDIHVSTDPTEKDIFIYDKHGLFQKYYEPQNPSHLTWHYVKDDQIILLFKDKLNELHRVVNFNKVSQYFYAWQYAVVLYKDNGTREYCEFGGGKWAAGVTYGEKEYRDCAGMAAAKGFSAAGDQYPSPVKQCIETVVYMGTLNIAVAGFDDKVLAAKILENQIGITVKHEIGHYIGIPHHYDDQNVTQGDSLHGDSTRKGNTCGAKDCLMRYAAATELKPDLLSKDLTTYCGNNEVGYDFWQKEVKHPDGTKTLNFRKIAYIFNTDCYGKITIKSSP